MISIQNTDDNEYFKWCLVRYLNPADHNPRRVTEADKDFQTDLILKTKFPVKIRNVHKIEKRNSIGISSSGYGNK